VRIAGDLAEITSEYLLNASLVCSRYISLPCVSVLLPVNSPWIFFACVMVCIVMYIVAYRPVAGQRPQSRERVQLLLYNRQINKHPFISNSRWAHSCGRDIQSIAVHPSMTTIEGLLEAVFSVGSSLRLYNEDASRAAVRVVSSSVE
jgi:hypothetical protein